MSAENVEIVRRLLAEASQNHEVAIASYDFDRLKVYPRPDEPGAREVYEGAEGLTEYAANWFGQWDSYEFDVVETIDAGDDVLVVMHEKGRLEKSGIEVEQNFHHSFKLEGGKIIEWRQYETREQALKSLGLGA